jgi:hypothetical protein
MNWSPRLPASFSHRFSRLTRSRPTWTSPPGARHLRQPLDRAVQGSLQPRHPHTGALEQRPARAVRLTDQGAQQVHRLDVLVVVVQGEALGIGQGLLELGGEFIQTHGFDTRSGVWLCQR